VRAWHHSAEHTWQAALPHAHTTAACVPAASAAPPHPAGCRGPATASARPPTPGRFLGWCAAPPPPPCSLTPRGSARARVHAGGVCACMACACVCVCGMRAGWEGHNERSTGAPATRATGTAHSHAGHDDTAHGGGERATHAPRGGAAAAGRRCAGGRHTPQAQTWARRCPLLRGARAAHLRTGRWTPMRPQTPLRGAWTRGARGPAA
jgi:hypothetical protein